MNKIRRLNSLIILLAPCFFLLCIIGCKDKKIPPRDEWNILWIVIDDLNIRHLGCYGYSRDISPNMDGLAMKGVRFEGCITQAPWTLPSFASMLSSRYPYEVVLTKEYLRHLKAKAGKGRSWDSHNLPGFNYHWYCPVPGDVNLLSEILKDQGFETFAWTNNYWLQPETSGLKRGFDVYNYTDKTDKYYLLAEEILTKTAEWIKGKKKKKWFAFVHLMEPHIPHHRHQGFDLGPRQIDRYDAEISYMDKEIGKFFSSLEKIGLWQNTIIVVNADHGELISPDGTRTLGHGVMTLQVMRVPLIISYPGCREGAVVNDIVRNIDIMPTLLEIVNADLSAGLRGQSLVALLEGGNESEPRPAFSMASLKGPEQISLLLDGCKGVVAPAYGSAGFKNLMVFGKKCGNEEQVRNMLENFRKEVEEFLTAAPEKQPVRIDPKDREKLKALGYFK